MQHRPAGRIRRSTRTTQSACTFQGYSLSPIGSRVRVPAGDRRRPAPGQPPLPLHAVPSRPGARAYDPDEVPPATDAPPEPDPAQSAVFQEARAEVRREYGKDELTLEHERSPHPPTRYDE
jgi:hypothetical protein